MKHYIETQRLILRSWQEEDIPHLARMNGNERVMEYFLKTLSYEETITLYNQIQEEFTKYGFGAYAVQEKQSGAFVGFVGLHNVTFEVDFAPAVEILWATATRILGQRICNWGCQSLFELCKRWTEAKRGGLFYFIAKQTLWKRNAKNRNDTHKRVRPPASGAWTSAIQARSI